MSERNEDEGASPIDQPSRRLGFRRTVLGGFAGVALLMGPVALSKLVVPDEDTADVKTGGGDEDTLFAALGNRTAAAEGASEDLLNQALATQEATVEAKPAAPTTTTTSSTTTTTTTTTTTSPTSEEPPPTTEEAPPPESGGGGLGDPYYLPTWDKLAECESGGDWSINTGNGYYGGIQFNLQSWQAVGGTGYPHEHSRETQITMGQRLWERQGWGAWPACTASFGWR